MYDHVFAASEKPVLARAIESDSAGKSAIGTLLSYYADMESKIRGSVGPDDYDPLDASNVHDWLRMYGWQKMNSTQLVYHPQKHSGPSDNSVFKALTALGRILETQIAYRDVKEFISRRQGHIWQWEHVFSPRRSNYTDEQETRNWVIRSNLGYRVNGQWSIGAQVTNEKLTVHRNAGMRIYLVEYFHLTQSGKLAFQPFSFDLNYKPELRYWGNRPFNKGPKEQFVKTVVSTSVEEFAGRPEVSFFVKEQLKDNLAVMSAMMESNVPNTREALELSQPQNTTVFLFPLLMSLLPLALFADVSDKLLLVYMIFTDFLAVLPVAIKGVEILLTANTDFFSTRTLVRGDVRNQNSTVAATTWSCRCELAGHPAMVGASFVCLAVFAMVVGVALELFVKAKVNQNKREAAKAKLFSEEWDEYLWTRKYLCGDCDCHIRPEKTPVTGGLIGQLLQERKKAKTDSVLDLGKWP